jgi:hypothetical protein
VTRPFGKTPWRKQLVAKANFRTARHKSQPNALKLSYTYSRNGTTDIFTYNIPCSSGELVNEK